MTTILDGAGARATAGRCPVVQWESLDCDHALNGRNRVIVADSRFRIGNFVVGIRWLPVVNVLDDKDLVGSAGSAESLGRH